MSRPFVVTYKRSVVVLLLLLTLAAGCTRSQKRRIAVIPKATSHIFWLTVQAGAMSAGRDFGVDVLWNGPATETDYARQMQILDSMVSQRVDGIAIAASERTALLQSLNRAAAQGIPVTVFDSGVDGENYLTFVATNNYEAGQLGARELARLLNSKGNIALLMHAPGSASTTERERGFEDAITKEFPGIKIVARQYGLSDRAKARAATENFLTAYPNLDGLFASSEPSSAGAALALESRGLGGKVKFVAFDSNDAMIQDMREGTIHAIVVQDPFRMGYEAVRTLVDKLNGKNPPKRMDLNARVIVKEDLDKPEIRELLNPDLKKYLGTQ